MNEDEAKTLVATEYDALRKEIATHLAQIHALELTVLATIGAIWAWLFTHPDSPPMAWFIPVVLVILAGAKATALFLSVRIVGRYIAERETALFPTPTIEHKSRVEPLGKWELYRRRKSAGLVATAAFFWVGLLVATSFVGWWRPNVASSNVESSAISLRCAPDAADPSSGIALRCTPRE